MINALFISASPSLVWIVTSKNDSKSEIDVRPQTGACRNLRVADAPAFVSATGL